MRTSVLLAALSAVFTLAFASVAMAQSSYAPPDSTVDCSAVEEGHPPGIEFYFVPDAGGCIAEGYEGGGTPNPMLYDFGKVVFDPDTGERLGTVRELDPDLSSGANSLTYQEFCGSFDGLPERARTAQEYFEQGADAEEQAILDPDGDGLACTAEDTAFLAGDTLGASSPEREGFWSRMSYYWEGIKGEPRSAWEGLVDTGRAGWAIGQSLLAGRTPMPECHGQWVRTPSRGRITIESHNKVMTWACLETNGEYVTVALTNTFSAPLLVRSTPPGNLDNGSSSISDGILIEGGKLVGENVLPLKSQGNLVFRVDKLPATVEFSTDMYVNLGQAVPLTADVGLKTFKSYRLAQAAASGKTAIDCADSAYREDTVGTITCLVSYAGKTGSLAALALSGGIVATSMLGGAIDQATDIQGDGYYTIRYEPPDETVQNPYERFVGDWYVHGSQMSIRPDFTGVKSNSLGPCTNPFGPHASDAMCNEVAQLEFSEASSGGIVGTVTSVSHETWEGNPPPPGFEDDGNMQIGDSFKLEFVDGNLLRITWLGRLAHWNDGPGNPYWCNSQTSDENIPKCGA